MSRGSWPYQRGGSEVGIWTIAVVQRPISGVMGAPMRGHVGVSIRLLVLAFVIVGIAHADILSLGTFSYDQLVSGAPGSPGIDGFTISNLTGIYSLPLSFPVNTAVVLNHVVVTITDLSGKTSYTIGDVSPGFTSPASLMLLDSAQIESAELLASLSTTTFTLSDGHTFVADSPVVDFVFVPGSGPSLQAGIDFALLDVSGSILSSTVPEPSALPLFTVVSIAAAVFRRFRRISKS